MCLLSFKAHTVSMQYVCNISSKCTMCFHVYIKSMMGGQKKNLIFMPPTNSSPTPPQGTHTHVLAYLSCRSQVLILKNEYRIKATDRHTAFIPDHIFLSGSQDKNPGV